MMWRQKKKGVNLRTFQLMEILATQYFEYVKERWLSFVTFHKANYYFLF